MSAQEKLRHEQLLSSNAPEAAAKLFSAGLLTKLKQHELMKPDSFIGIKSEQDLEEIKQLQEQALKATEQAEADLTKMWQEAQDRHLGVMSDHYAKLAEFKKSNHCEAPRTRQRVGEVAEVTEGAPAGRLLQPPQSQQTRTARGRSRHSEKYDDHQKAVEEAKQQAKDKAVRARQADAPPDGGKPPIA